MTTVLTKWFVVVITLVVARLSFAQTPSVVPQPIAVDGATGHVYKSVGADQLRLHVFSVESAEIVALRPAIVFFFGGGWAQGSVTQFVPQAKYLARRGMVAIVADYRVLDRHGTT